MVRIYNDHIRLVYETAASFLGKGQAAEEVCYEVFLSLAQSGAHAPPQHALPTYLEIITRLRARESAFRLRRKYRAKGASTPKPFRVRA
jgi:DNA-directed RNA polymerase specialized sigma24 family protein